jgi:hypothetical protein
MVQLGACVVLAGEAVISNDGVVLVARIAELALSVLVKLADGAHSRF